MENKFDSQFLIEGHDLDVLEYAAALGELNTIIVENMERQAKGLHG